ncbi:MAG: DUF3631 domain-containing protein [Methylophilaceae bacterium]
MSTKETETSVSEPDANKSEVIKPEADTHSTIKKEILESQKFRENLPFPVYKPHKQPVELASILDEVSTTIRKLVILEREQAETAALWIVHTYIVNVFSISPLLIINAPERACAKTLFQTVIADMSFKPLSASNVTPSSLFRSIELWQPTMFFDEADTFFKENNDLKGMVNAGNSKKNGFVLRSEAVGDSFEPRKFSVFGAKSIAGIALEKHLPDATLSRGIIFKMRRKLPDESVTRLRDVDPKLFKTFSSKLMRIAIDYCDEINTARPELPKELSDRAQDNWEPLLAIASCASEEWLQRATAAALKLSSASNESMSTGNELLSDIQYIFESKSPEGQSLEKISTVNLIEQLSLIHDGPWKTFNNGHEISPRQLSKQLSYYDIKPKTVRIGAYDTPKGYSLDQFTDAFSRYLTPSMPEEIDDSLAAPEHNKPDLGSSQHDPDY